MTGRLLLVAVLALLARPAAAEPLRVVGFAGASNLPFWAGQEEGLFAAHGIAASLDLTPSSEAMARNLQAGRYDLALTAVDNVVAYDEGEGEATLGSVDFVALFGVDDGMLSLVAAPTVASVAALDGKPIPVDAETTGFAFALREIMSRAGVVNISLVKVGGGAQRLAALLDGRGNATLLNTPLDIIAESHGFHPLVRITNALGAYQGIVAAVRRDQLGPQRDQLVAFTQAFHESVAWVSDPAHHSQLVALLTSHLPGLTPPAAERAYTALLDPQNGLYRDLQINPAGLQTVLALRSKYGIPHKELTDPARYLDRTILDAAIH